MSARAKLERELARLTAQSRRLSERRMALPPGSSRARVTSANARWARVAEARDRVAAQLADVGNSNIGDES